MTKLDLRKELKAFYAPSAKKVEVVDLPRQRGDALPVWGLMGTILDSLEHSRKRVLPNA